MKAVDLLYCFVFFLVADSVSADDGTDFIDDNYIRSNPEFETDRQFSADTVDLSCYSFLSAASNAIKLNGADWSLLADAFERCEEKTVRIVHIGDSHIQADMSTGYTRRLLQERFGSAGRGLIVPLKLAATNEPSDYSITSSSVFSQDKLISYPWREPMGFTGIALTPQNNDFDFKIAASDPFERVYIYYNGSPLSVNSVTYNGSSLVYAVHEDIDCIEIGLPFPCEEIAVELSSFGKVSVYGMELVSDIIGVVYHAIGINGATYSSYNRVEEFGRAISRLEPDLIIVSLGTNEAFGRIDVGDFEKQIDFLVSDLQKNNPDACILLATPSECQRRLRRRRSYTVNSNIAAVRDVISRYAGDHDIAVYDWYEAAGGKGSSAKWIDAGLFSRDRIHYSRTGYEVAGRMLFDALIDVIKQYRL